MKLKRKKKSALAKVKVTKRLPNKRVKPVVLFVSWDDEGHILEVDEKDWVSIQAGEEITLDGSDYDYEGESFTCYWWFNGLKNEGPNCLIVGYGDDGAEGYVGTWDEAFEAGKEV
jgi:hypothetical protein